MKFVKISTLWLGILFAVCSASAQVTFLFHDGVSPLAPGSTFDDESGSVMATVGGITLTAEAFLDGVSNDTDFNTAGDGFGINATGTGDETQRFDNDLGIESMVFSFDVAGVFDTLDLEFIEESENEGLLIFDGGTTYQLNTVTSTGASDAFNIGESFTAGQSITLTLSGSAAAGENFSLQSITVSAVPEPSTYAALAGIVILGFAAYRRRNQKLAA